MNTGQNRTSNRFRTGRNENRQETRRNQANFNEFLGGLPAPYSVDVAINLTENWISILDSGVGMSLEQVASACAPNVSFKNEAASGKRGKKHMYRGYKGVGLTFLAYGTDEIVIHSKNVSGEFTKARMEHGRLWAEGSRLEPALIVEDAGASPLEKSERGTYVKVQFSPNTRPKSLSKLAGSLEVWKTILRTKTALGQILLGRDPVCAIKSTLTVIENGREATSEIIPQFLYPHEIKRKPDFRFLDLPQYFESHSERSAPPPEKLRQDGLYLRWGTERIRSELTSEQQTQFKDELAKYTPEVYAFVPYQGALWTDLNRESTGVKNRKYIYPGLMIAVNRQRLADISEISASRFETFSRNVLVIVHLDGAKPDQGRKTLEVEASELAQKIADRAVQYIAKQRTLLRAPGESPTPEQRQVEKDHGDWVFNVRTHAKASSLETPPASYISTPLQEQDVVGLFHQFSALGVFAGIRIYATSQSQTYDCLAEFNCLADQPGLLYRASDDNPLGVSPYTLGTKERFSTKHLTIEFKNNLDGLIADVDGGGPKSFGNIDVCVCWGQIGAGFQGYEIEEISENNLDERQFPGVTHLLRRDGDVHVIKIIMLEAIVAMIKAGRLTLPVS
jgi:hypothetical protein